MAREKLKDVSVAMALIKISTDACDSDPANVQAMFNMLCDLFMRETTEDIIK